MGMDQSTAFGVQLRLARWPALEAPVCPQVLLGALTQHAFDPLIDADAIFFFGLARETFKRWMNHQTITAAVGQTLLGERHHQCLAQPGELAGGGDRRA